MTPVPQAPVIYSSPGAEGGAAPPASARNAGGLASRRSRPGSAGSGRGSHGAAAPQYDHYSYDAFLTRQRALRPHSAGSYSARQRPRSAGSRASQPSSVRSGVSQGWRVAGEIPRTFEELARNFDRDAVEDREAFHLKWGPKEEQFRAHGDKLEDEAHAASAREAAQAKDGVYKRQFAEEVRRSLHHQASGDAWKSGHYVGGRQCGVTPGHVAAGRGSKVALFSQFVCLEAGESQHRYEQAKRRGELSRRSGSSVSDAAGPPPPSRPPRPVSRGRSPAVGAPPRLLAPTSEPTCGGGGDGHWPESIMRRGVVSSSPQLLRCPAPVPAVC
eukprot:TRINITY_DN75189_c0_g1_i1.p1 TRINITY_DN75189_c0_g1~~TRINITY_DN75189_c0_g1_i1.p1  ORF type:complete len:329 (+),score=44.14 TRINITY_DN75189_c0_g1_i1:66-1052(+)